MNTKSKPFWQLPRGVPRGLWDYLQAPEIAQHYDQYFAFNTLFDFDQQVLLANLPKQGLVVDLGSGTGRALVPLVRHGRRGLAVDLSRHMLNVVQEKAKAENLPIECVQANLVELDCLQREIASSAICMFSTLGMIRGRDNRRKMLRHTYRILQPGGQFILHVHNLWFNLFDPGGPWWVLSSVLRAVWRSKSDLELGDKFFPYRGIPNMFLHVFRRGELLGDLRGAGFRIKRVIPLDAARRHELPRPWLAGFLRANGWIVICEKPAQAFSR